MSLSETSRRSRHRSSRDLSPVQG